MHPTRVHCGLLPILFCFLCSTVSAQPIGTHRDSLQWMIARADAIVRGRVESVVAINPGDSYSVFYQVTLKTQSRIAGEVGERVRFVSSNKNPYIGLKKQGHSGLFFLVQSQFDFNRLTYSYFYSRFPFVCKNMIDLDGKSASVTSEDSRLTSVACLKYSLPTSSRSFGNAVDNSVRTESYRGNRPRMETIARR